MDHSPATSQQTGKHNQEAASELGRDGLSGAPAGAAAGSGPLQAAPAAEKLLKDEFAPGEGGRPALFFAVLVGFLGLAGICLFTGWYEGVVTRSYYAPTTNQALPPAVFFLLALVLLLLNPLLARLAPALFLRKRELLVILSLWLLASVVCYLSLAQPLTSLVGTALNQDQAKATVQRVKLDQYLAPRLFLDTAASNKFHYGIGDGMRRVALADIPWADWLRPLGFWIPFSLLTVLLGSALVRMVHRQWSKHELLTYPLADFSHTLLEYRPGARLPAVFYHRGFMIGALLICLVYLVNGLQGYFPLMVNIPLSYFHMDIIKSFPFIQKYCGREGYSLFRGHFYPLVICIAVLLPTEISFSCWAGWVLMVLGTGFYFLVTGEVIGTTETGFLTAGMYVAMLCAIVFVGRKEYAAICRHAFSFRKSADAALNAAARACRVFVAVALLMVCALAYAGMDLLTAAAFVAAFSLVVILAARFTAETGIPWLVNFSGTATYLPLTILGAAAVGPRSMALLATVGAVFAVGNGMANTVAIQETTVGKAAEKTVAPEFRKWFNIILFAGLLAALLLSIAANLSNSYSVGGGNSLSGVNWPNEMEGAAKKVARLEVEGLAGKAAGFGLAEKAASIQADPGFWRFFCFGAVLVGLCMFMRLRFTWWPFHPLPLLMLNEWCMSRLYVSFLAGWLIKTAILRVGGGKVFSDVKPFFLGVIFGQCLIAGGWAVVNTIYYLLTDTPPPNIQIFP